ncbi:MAG: tRNA (N6-threonylcarbamoyladenosine(37)-N6)-methyltransferase TrmO [Deltaproteobacteria bacterium]|jgi:tRNA (adenine37-N6)-methyltransferase|nr:tRNA (N6-threonylcarbamoyladenosine(37)-N6)-methyltransferase TrmO [Deltaproteobacteria bacterium]MBT6433428.1 tRNA (N6-threonylcarbamoyladenosine(37)-N6)-methyltransferase TrmO [Deltaproteobacteria bacterium]
MSESTNYNLKPIGYIQSPFKEKFGIPRQPGLAPNANAVLVLVHPFNRIESVRGLDEFTHIWISFLFHGVDEENFRPMVRPPRLGGNQRLGVFATRSTHRPNRLGLSAVKLDRIDTSDGVKLFLSGVDLLDETPVFDIKPYLPWSDSLPDAQAGFAQEAPNPKLEVLFSDESNTFLEMLGERSGNKLQALVEEVVSLDPRPAYIQDQDSERSFGCKLKRYNIIWTVTAGVATIESIETL